MDKQNKITIHQIFWYFLIFSIVGLLIETIYCYATAGVLESRKGLIWGPFCPIYGVSAAILIVFLNRYKDKNTIQLFIYGFIIGSIAEYVISYVLEAIYGMRFWNYEYAKLHLNGRICMQYSIYWGLLSIFIIKMVKPIIDKLVNKMNENIRNHLEIILLIFFIVDCIFTVWGIQTYENRVINGKTYNYESSNICIQIKQKIENDYFTNERISKTFPNLRIKDERGNEIWVKTLIKGEE